MAFKLKSPSFILSWYLTQSGVFGQYEDPYKGQKYGRSSHSLEDSTAQQGEGWSNKSTERWGKVRIKGLSSRIIQWIIDYLIQWSIIDYEIQSNP